MKGTENKPAAGRSSPNVPNGAFGLSEKIPEASSLEQSRDRRRARRASGISLEFLKVLSECPGVSGYEAPVRDLLRGFIEPYVDSIAVDAIGNLIAVIDTVREDLDDDSECDEGAEHSEGAVRGEFRRNAVARFGKKDCPRAVRVLLVAHMDEVGILVTHIEKDGTLRFGCVGGIDASVLPAKRVSIGKNGVPGVILYKPIHLEKRNAEVKPPTVESLFIDIGAADLNEAKKMVALGDFGVFATAFGQLGDGRAKGKAFDDRVGCLILAELIKRRSVWAGRGRISNSDTGRDQAMTVGFAFTVQEEIGLRGAACAAYAFNPDMALVIEGTICQDTPGTKPHEVITHLGEGPVLTFMDRASVADRRILEELQRIAKKRGIKVQYKEGTAGGNDAGAIHLTRAGVPTATVSVPCRYIHSPVSVTSISDIEDTLSLVEGFLQSVSGGFYP